jgi:hypothetical protein
MNENDYDWGSPGLAKRLGIDNLTAGRLLFTGIIPAERIYGTYGVSKESLERTLATPLGELLAAAKGRRG